MKDMLRIFVPSGMLGYGFPMEDFKRGIAMNPDYITVDSGSTDSGPQKLALGSMTCPREAYVDELEIILSAAREGREKGIPLYISSAGGDGSAKHVDEFCEIVRALAVKHGWRLKIALIYADIDKELVKKKLASGAVRPCGPAPEITNEEIDQATVIVAQMGVEPFLKVLEEHPDVDVIISGRAYDPVPIAALPIKLGFSRDLAWHMGKILECGGKCAVPTSRGIVAELYRDHFRLIPLGEDQRCTTYSVAAHTLYEKSHPYLLPGPGGTLDVSKASFVQEDERVVRVSGSKFVEEPYTIKLEGAKVCGCRSICVAGIRDPLLVAQIDDFLPRVEEQVRLLPAKVLEGSRTTFHVYGKNGVMGECEMNPDFVPQELCVIYEAMAPTQEAATQICNRARVRMLHMHYEGRVGTSGNVGLPFTPLEIPLGAVAEFSIYHLMEIDDPVALFPIRYEEV